MVEGCRRCLGLRGSLSPGALRTCLASLSGLVDFLALRNVGILRIYLSSLRHFATKLRSVNVRPHSRTHVLSKVGSFFHFLLVTSCLRTSPDRLLRKPGVNFGLPRILAIRRVSQVVSTISHDGTRKRQGETVLRALCDYKLHMSRLIGLGLSSLCFSRNFVGIRKGNDGRQLIPVSPHTVGRVGLCFASHGQVRMGGRCRSFMFIDRQENGKLSQVVVFRVVGRLTRATNVVGGVDPRAFHRSFTARLLRNKTGLQTVRYVLKRRSVTAARVCARVSHGVLHDRVVRRRPQGVGCQGRGRHWFRWVVVGSAPCPCVCVGGWCLYIAFSMLSEGICIGAAVFRLRAFGLCLG